MLLIDEVDELNAYDPRVNQRLRSLFMKSFAENLVAVVSGVEIRKQWDKEGSPWYNFFEEIEVTPIGRDDVVELITKPIGGVFKIDEPVVDRIIELTDRKPYHVQRMCIALVNRMYEEGRRQITIADVDAVAGPRDRPGPIRSSSVNGSAASDSTDGSSLIEEILDGPRNSLWLLGTRGIGKTSLLKQLEHLTAAAEHAYVPIFGIFKVPMPGGARLLFRRPARCRGSARGHRHRALRIRGKTSSPRWQLRRGLRSQGDHCSCVRRGRGAPSPSPGSGPAAQTPASHAVAGRRSLGAHLLGSPVRAGRAGDDTSPFLHGFSPPLYISGLSSDETLSLVRQEQSPSGSRPEIDDADAAEICAVATPSLSRPAGLQAVLGDRDLEEACRQVASDRMINYFFSVDFEMLSATERSVLRLIADQGTATDDSIHAVMKTDTADRDDALKSSRISGSSVETKSGTMFCRAFSSAAGSKTWRTPEAPATRPGTEGRGPTISVRTIDGRYTLHEEIGAGATGSVFKARDTLLDTWVAVKLLKPEYTANDSALDRVRQEILLSRDIAHPNILRVYHLASYEGATYITMRGSRAAPSLTNSPSAKPSPPQRS